MGTAERIQKLHTRQHNPTRINNSRITDARITLGRKRKSRDEYIKQERSKALQPKITTHLLIGNGLPSLSRTLSLDSYVTLLILFLRAGLS